MSSGKRDNILFFYLLYLCMMGNFSCFFAVGRLLLKFTFSGPSFNSGSDYLVKYYYPSCNLKI